MGAQEAAHGHAVEGDAPAREGLLEPRRTARGGARRPPRGAGCRRRRRRRRPPAYPRGAVQDDAAPDDREHGPALEHPAPERRVAALASRSCSGSTCRLRREVEHGHVRGRPGREACPRAGPGPARGSSRGAPRAAPGRGAPGATSRSRQRATAVSRPTIPNGRLVELHLLVVHGVGRVVGGDAVDGAVAQALEQRPAVGLAAQGRVHLGGGVVLAVLHQLVGQQQVVRRRLGGDAHAAGLAPAGRRPPRPRSRRGRCAGGRR